MKKRAVCVIMLSLILVIGFKAFSNSEEPAEKKILNAAQVIKKIDAQIFYPEQQENLKSADYTLIYGMQQLMTQLRMKLKYGDKKRAQGEEQGSFSPSKKDGKKETADKAITWPSYTIQMGAWNLADPAHLLMQLFIIPLDKTFPEDKWTRELKTQNEDYELVFTPQIPRPTPVTPSPFFVLVNSVSLMVDKTFLVHKIRLTFDQSFTKQHVKPGSSQKFIEDSDVEVSFTKHKDKLLIQELKQKIRAANRVWTPIYRFEFKEISGFLLPTIKDMVLPGEQIGGQLMRDMEMHFIVEYLDYKVKKKK